MPKNVIRPNPFEAEEEWGTTPVRQSRASGRPHRVFDAVRHLSRAAGRPIVRAMLALVLCAAALPSASAEEPAASLSMEGADLRLIAQAPDENGVVRAALLVDLAPGWKTYWLDPGEAGIPPHLDLSRSVNLAPVETSFPMPHRFGDAAGLSNGYSQPLAVALLLRRGDAAVPAAIDLSLTLGLCREICIPASARLKLEIGSASAADARLVAYAFDALPEPSTPQAGVVSARLSPDAAFVEVDVLAPDDRPLRKADLFLAGPDGWFFGAPGAPRGTGRHFTFAVPVTERPRAAGTLPPGGIDALLDLGSRAFRATNLRVDGPR
jgi:DsbC/DsbD-like thiol-disulfide interchange protein